MPCSSLTVKSSTARALVAAADADRGPQALRTAAVIRLLVHNALRVDEACAAHVTDLGTDAGHRGRRQHPGPDIPDGHVFTRPWPAGSTAKDRNQVIYYHYKADGARRTLRGTGEQIVKARKAIASKAAGQAEPVRPAHRRHQEHRPRT